MRGSSSVELTEHDHSAADTVCMIITFSASMDQLGKVANPARGQLNREKEHFPVHVRA